MSLLSHFSSQFRGILAHFPSQFITVRVYLVFWAFILSPILPFGNICLLPCVNLFCLLSLMFISHCISTSYNNIGDNRKMGAGCVRYTVGRGSFGSNRFGFSSSKKSKNTFFGKSHRVFRNVLSNKCCKGGASRSSAP
jgi:hypothetical protein